MFITLRSQMIVDMNDALLDANPNVFLYGTLLMGGGKKGVSLSARTLLLVCFVVLVFPIFLADVVKRCLPRCVLCGRVICRSVVLLALLVLSDLSLCAKSDITETRYDIEGVETGTTGTYLVKVYVYSKKPVVTAEEFKYAAVHGVIFKGFETKRFTAQKPMVDAGAQSANGEYFKCFFNDGEYADYARVINPVAGRVKIGKEYKVAATVSVLKDALRKTLEKQGIVRSLNSGF